MLDDFGAADFKNSGCGAEKRAEPPCTSALAKEKANADAWVTGGGQFAKELPGIGLEAFCRGKSRPSKAPGGMRARCGPWAEIPAPGGRPCRRREGGSPKCSVERGSMGATVGLPDRISALLDKQAVAPGILRLTEHYFGFLANAAASTRTEHRVDSRVSVVRLRVIGELDRYGRRAATHRCENRQGAAGPARNDLPNAGLRVYCPVVSTTSVQACDGGFTCVESLTSVQCLGVWVQGGEMGRGELRGWEGEGVRG